MLLNDQTIWTILGIVVLILGFGYLFLKYRPRKVENERKRVSKALRAYARPRGFQVMDQVTLVSNGLSGWADHVLVGYFGILLVYDLYMPGEYFGGPTDETWRVNSDGSWYAMTNPIPPASQCEGRVRTLLKDAGYRVDVGRVVVVTGDKRKTLLAGLKCPEAVCLGDLRKFLDRERFNEDKGLDIAAMTALLEGALKKEPVAEKA